MIPLSEMTDAREMCFSFDGYDGTSFTLAIERLIKDPLYKELEIVLVPVTEEQAKYCYKNNGIEIPQLEKTYVKMATGHGITPITLLDYGNGEHIIADGNHRYVAAFLIHAKDIPARLVPKELWDKYTIDLPDKLDLKKLNAICTLLNRERDKFNRERDKFNRERDKFNRERDKFNRERDK